LIVDAQSVKNTDTAMHKYEAGKKISGIKRHIAVDTLDLPHALAVSTADVPDWACALQALEPDAGGRMRNKNPANSLFLFGFPEEYGILWKVKWWLRVDSNRRRNNLF